MTMEAMEVEMDFASKNCWVQAVPGPGTNQV